MNNSMKTQSALYPIREVSRLTGVNAITLRAWERRYDLFDPVRTESGHRLFTQAHIDLINRAVKLTEQGIPISQAKRLLDEQSDSVTVASSGEDYDYGEALLKALTQSDIEHLNRGLDTLFSELDDASSNLMLRQLSLKINQQSMQERMLWRSVLLPRLYVRLHNMTRNLSHTSSQRIWLQASEDNQSEVLLVLVGLHFVTQGWYPLLHVGKTAELKPLFNSIQALKCQALAVVDDSEEMDGLVWNDWVERYPALDFYYFVNQNEIGLLGQKLSVHYQRLNRPF